MPPDLLAFARQLRQQQTDAETRLWYLLRDRRFLGLKFRRQAPMPPYVLDFYCHELRLAVELDGGQHNSAEGQAKDRVRTDALALQGVNLVRFWNDEFLRNTEGALEVLYDAVQDRRRELGGFVSAEAPSSGPAGHLLPVGEGVKGRIRTLAEHLDAHRKRQQAAHADLTLTGI